MEFLTCDRDRVQTITVPAAGSAFRSDRITVRLGPVSASGSLGDAKGAPVFIRLFEVTSTARIHDHGTTGGEGV